jgi:hypothetical protein
MANRIHNKGTYRQEEIKANSALIYPGFLLEIDANGEVIPHATEGGTAEAIFAAEDALQGNTVSTIYADDSIVTCIIPNKGSVVNALIEAGQSISIGDKLMSRGNGKLVEHRDLDSANPLKDPENIIAIAEEAVPNGASDVLAAVRIV